jgi:predicted dehydrogenase
VTLRVALLGYGYWGRNLARNFAATEGCELVAIADVNEARAHAGALAYPAARAEAEAGGLIASADVDAVVIATPPPSHYDLAARSLQAGKHVLVEKPLTTRLADAEHLVALANRAARTLMVDHTVVYSGAARAIAQTIREGRLGDLWFVEGSRLQAPVRDDVNVVEDLGVHDFALLEYSLGARPLAVAATGFAAPSSAGAMPASLAHVQARYPGLDAHLRLSWLAPMKERRMLFAGSRGMLLFDDLEADEPLRLYERPPDRAEHHRDGYSAPTVDRREPLAAMASHFIECATQGRRPITDGLAGLRAVRAVGAATASLANGGALVPIES